MYYVILNAAIIPRFGKIKNHTYKNGGAVSAGSGSNILMV